MNIKSIEKIWKKQMLRLFSFNSVLLVCLSSVTFSGLCLDWTTTGTGCALRGSSPAYGWSYFLDL